MKEQIKAPEKNTTKGQRDSQPIRCTVQNTGNQEAHKTWVELDHKLDEKNEGYAKRRKENVQGTNSDGKETATQINGLDQKEEISIQPEQNEETEFKKMRRGLGTSRTSLNIPTSEL